MHIVVGQQRERETIKRESRKVPFGSDNSEKGICQQTCISICSFKKNNWSRFSLFPCSL